MKVGELYFSLGIQPDASWGKAREMLGGLGARVRGGLGGAVGGARRAAGLEGVGPEYPGGAFLGPGRRNDGSNRSVNWATSTGDPFNGGKGGGRGGGGAGGGPAGGPGGSFFKRLRGGIADLNLFRRALYGTFAVQTVKVVSDLADSYTNMHNRLVTLTGSQEEAEKQYQKGRDVAKATRSDLEGTVEAYVRISNATKELGMSSDKTWQFVTSVQQAMQMSGASASEAKSGMEQFTQALSKGKLDGDEFKSIAENMPSILTIMGKALHKTEGQIRSMSKSGELTRKVIVDAFTKMGGSIQNDFGKTVPTIAQGWQQFKNEMIDSVGRMATAVNLGKIMGQVFTLVTVALKGVIYALQGIFYVVGAVVGAFTSLWEAASNGSDEALAALIGIGAAIAYAIIPSIIAFGELVLFTVVPALYEMAVAAWASLGPYALIIAAVALVAYGIIKIVRHWDEVKAAAGRVWAWIKDVAEGVWEGIQSGMSAAFDFIVDSPGVRMLLYLVDKLKDLEDFFGGVGDAVMSPDELQSKLRNGSLQMGSTNLNDSGGGGKNVSVGPTTVNIYAKDAADAKQKFDADQLDRANRHAAAALGR